MESIEKLVAQANKSYALGRYEEAADVYAQASEELVEVNGEDSPKNADVMFLYGRTLVKIAMQKSEVLGGNAQEEQPAVELGKGKGSAESARFSFQGDEEVDEGDDGDEDDEAEEPQTTADEDFQNAWEVLDLARISFQHQLDAEEDQTSKTEIKKRIADTYDLLGEIALENENFDQAVGDLKAALELKKELYDETSSQRSGAHYMLALALEYCTSDSSRDEAAKEVQNAITIFERRIEAMDKDDKQLKSEKEMLEELRLKCSELQAPRESFKREEVADIFGKEGAALKDTLVQAMQNSNDLSGLVRKKDKKRSAPDTKPQASEDVTNKKSKTEDA